MSLAAKKDVSLLIDITKESKILDKCFGFSDDKDCKIRLFSKRDVIKFAAISFTRFLYSIDNAMMRLCVLNSFFRMSCLRLTIILEKSHSFLN